MTQLTAADAGITDASSYTAASYFQYNANAFGRNVAMGAAATLVPALSQEPDVTNGGLYQYNSPAENTDYRTFVTDLSVVPFAPEQAAVNGGLFVYDRSGADMCNVKDIASPGRVIFMDPTEHDVTNSGLYKYNHPSETCNIESRAETGLSLQKEVQNDASILFHTTGTGAIGMGERMNVKQLAITLSDSSVLVPKAITNVWGMHSPGSI